MYGATISPSYYLYTTETEITVHETNEPTKLYDEDNNVTNWRWTFTADGDNLLGLMPVLEDYLGTQS